jgi:hypothetical protein
MNDEMLIEIVDRSMVEAAAAKVTVAGSKSGTISDPLKWLIRLGSGWVGSAGLG